jgi:Zn-dependent membrane protease YugP
MYSFGAIIIGVVFMIIGFIVSNTLKRKFNKYSKMRHSSGMSGAEAAEKMLNYHGIRDVKIVSIPGKLTDHYNPMDKTVNLSPEVYEGRNAAAIAVATHECGHAVQHAKSYQWLTLRSKLVPMQNASGKILNIVIIASIFGGYALFQAINVNFILYVLIATYGMTTLFTFVTLPVEFDASNRALAWIKATGTSNTEEYEQSKDALKWAAMTYVVAALASLTTLLYYVSLLMRRN